MGIHQDGAGRVKGCPGLVHRPSSDFRLCWYRDWVVALQAGGPHLGRVSPTRVALNVGREKTGVPHFSRFSKSGPPNGQHYSGSDSSDTKTTKVTIGNLCQSWDDGPAIHILGKGRHAYPNPVSPYSGIL